MKKIAYCLFLIISFSVTANEENNFQEALRLIENQNYSEGISLFKSLAASGKPEAQYELGSLYSNGLGVDKNLTEAFKWFKLSAEQGFYKAQHELGVSYLRGYGVKQKISESMKWFQLAAEQGNPGSHYQIGYIYYYVKKDYLKAKNFFLFASEHGIAGAEVHLGHMYANGIGVEQDYSLAFKWFERAAKKNNPTAQYRLAQLHLGGRGTVLDENKAEKWFTLSAENGKVDAQHALGVIHYYKHNENAEALKWLRLAEKQNSQAATELIQKIFYNDVTSIYTEEGFITYDEVIINEKIPYCKVTSKFKREPNDASLPVNISLIKEPDNNIRIILSSYSQKFSQIKNITFNNEIIPFHYDDDDIVLDKFAYNKRINFTLLAEIDDFTFIKLYGYMPSANAMTVFEKCNLRLSKQILKP